VSYGVAKTQLANMDKYTFSCETWPAPKVLMAHDHFLKLKCILKINYTNTST